ncbi:MAG TPA: hypothetical protein VMJ32_12625 [Pirellulales bacterium]|nr:hypothetical protein [Pirellulales bacterium]
MLTLKKRADTLRTLLRQTTSEHKLNKAAAKVRDARIQVVRAQIGEMPSVKLTVQQKRRIAKLDLQIESLQAKTPTEILIEFRRMAKTAKLIQTELLPTSRGDAAG